MLYGLLQCHTCPCYGGSQESALGECGVAVHQSIRHVFWVPNLQHRFLESFSFWAELGSLFSCTLVSAGLGSGTRPDTVALTVTRHRQRQLRRKSLVLLTVLEATRPVTPWQTRRQGESRPWAWFPFYSLQEPLSSRWIFPIDPSPLGCPHMHSKAGVYYSQTFLNSVRLVRLGLTITKARLLLQNRRKLS